MLNINVDVKVKYTKPRFPIKLIGQNKCLHCGTEGSLTKIDIFGRESKQEIYPLDKIKCSACGYEYSIEWKDTGTGKLIPVPVHPSIKQEIVNTMNYLKIRKNGQPEI